MTFFLFYGTFCNTFLDENKELKYVKMQPFQAIWGYLVIDKILPVSEINDKNYSELKKHPHYINKENKSKVNDIYVGKTLEHLNIQMNSD